MNSLTYYLKINTTKEEIDIDRVYSFSTFNHQQFLIIIRVKLK
jgi:hypothetical protein